MGGLGLLKLLELTPLRNCFIEAACRTSTLREFHFDIMSGTNDMFLHNLNLHFGIV